MPSGNTRKLFGLCALVAVTSLLLGSVSQGADVAPWFTKYSHIFDNVHTTAISKADFVPGTTQDSMHCGATGPVGAGPWTVVKYDRAHHIALAVSNTDACALALFSAPPPGVTLPNADLSRYATGRGGIRIGSTYASVVAAYGGSHTPRGSHFTVGYAATTPGRTVTGKPIQNPVTLRFAIDNGRVSAIGVFVDLAGEV